MTEDERIVAFLDDELDAQARAEFSERIRADASLSAQVERHRRVKTLVGSTFKPVAGEPTPQTWSDAILAVGQAGGFHPRQRAWAAMAACLVAGVLAGRLAWPTQDVLAPGARVGGEIATALDRQGSATAAPVRIGLSFRRGDGRYCRTFTSIAAEVAGLACREKDGWLAQTVTVWRAGPDTSYRQLGSSTPSAVLASVDELIAGAPLTAEQEVRARGQGWRPD